MITITAAELQKQFGRYRDIAIREPVAVTHQGRESIVVLSADEYQRLKALDDAPRAHYAWEMPQDALEALEAASAPKFTRRYDDELKP